MFYYHTLLPLVLIVCLLISHIGAITLSVAVLFFLCIPLCFIFTRLVSIHYHQLHNNHLASSLSFPFSSVISSPLPYLHLFPPFFSCSSVPRLFQAIPANLPLISHHLFLSHLASCTFPNVAGIKSSSGNASVMEFLMFTAFKIVRLSLTL